MGWNIFKNRGEGDIFGVKQSGEIGLKLANVKRDFQMLLRAREDVLEFMPKLMNNHDEYKLIWDELEEIPDAD